MLKPNASHKTLFKGIVFVIFVLTFYACSPVLDWPKSPLYQFEHSVPETDCKNADSIKAKIIGHYAHFDVVAYEDTTTQTTMKTFIISYGFTDFFIEDGKLMQLDRFVHAEQKINQKYIISGISDAAVQAIQPRTQEVELNFTNQKWMLYRKPTPSLLGISGDPLKPLSTNPNDPNLTDPDNDGHPGVTVQILIAKLIKGEIYISRREIFTYSLTLNQDGTLTGFVEDDSEQFVIGASMKMLAQPSNSKQIPDQGMNPILLVPISPDIDTPAELMAIKDKLFPSEPEFVIRK